jgi:hypothetical protein
MSTWSLEHAALVVRSVCDLCVFGLCLCLALRMADAYQVAVAQVLHGMTGRAHLLVDLVATPENKGVRLFCACTVI